MKLALVLLKDDATDLSGPCPHVVMDAAPVFDTALPPTEMWDRYFRPALTALRFHQLSEIPR